MRNINHLLLVTHLIPPQTIFISRTQKCVPTTIAAMQRSQILSPRIICGFLFGVFISFFIIYF